MRLILLRDHRRPQAISGEYVRKCVVDTYSVLPDFIHFPCLFRQTNTIPLLHSIFSRVKNDL